MNTQAIALMSAQDGLITRGQAIRSGMAADQIDRWVRRGRWVVVRRGVYAERASVESRRSVREQRLLRDRAASMRIAAPHVMSHHSSAYLLGLEVLHERPEARTHVTRPGIVGTHQRHGVTHHRGPYRSRQVVEVDGLRCLGAARTVCDISRDQGEIAGLVAAESALRGGTRRSELRAAAAGMVSWSHVTTARAVNDSATGRTDSVGETLARALVTGLGHGVPWVQLGLTADGRTAWCDLCLGRHVFEFDGRMKYRRADEGGVATGSPEDAVWREKQRQDWVCGFKLGMSRLTWDEVFTIVTGGPALERVRARLQREYHDTCRRFGNDISDLAPYRPRGDRPRPASVRPLAA